MAVNCSTGFRARIMGPSSFESIFNYGCIEVRTGGDATALLDPLFAAGQWNGGVMGHTGLPRRHQRKTFDAPTQEATP